MSGQSLLCRAACIGITLAGLAEYLGSTYAASDTAAGVIPAVVYDNVTGNGGLNALGASPASQRDDAFPFDAGAADDFVLEAGPLCQWSITGVRWTGVYWGGTNPGTILGFRIVIWPDDEGMPGGAPATTPQISEALAVYEISGSAAETGHPSVAGAYDYALTLPTPFEAIPGVRYWIEIQAIMPFPPQWGVGVTSGRTGTGPFEYFDLLALPAWTAIADTGDLAFQLLGEPAEMNCDDGNACTVDACANGSCTHEPLSCDDGNACTTDSCDGTTGCVHHATTCDDNNACTSDACDPSTGCAFAPLSCDDGNACTTDTCDPATGCAHAAVTCDDGDACTTDSCDPATGCASTPLSCDDGDACTFDECLDGECTHSHPLDFDHDGDVDLKDFLTMNSCMLNAAGVAMNATCQCGDLNGDGLFNLADFALFQMSFTGGN